MVIVRNKTSICISDLAQGRNPEHPYSLTLSRPCHLPPFGLDAPNFISRWWALGCVPVRHCCILPFRHLAHTRLWYFCTLFVKRWSPTPCCPWFHVICNHDFLSVAPLQYGLLYTNISLYPNGCKIIFSLEHNFEDNNIYAGRVIADGDLLLDEATL